MADGSTVPSPRFLIRSLKVGDKVLENVTGGRVQTSRVAAPALRQNTPVADRIKELQAKAAERSGVSIERVLKELANDQTINEMERAPGTPLDNPKHELFAQGIAQGLTLGEAYAAAGYVEDRSNAYHLQQTTTVKDRIEELNAQAAVRAGVSIERVLKELAKIGFANLGD